MADKKEKATKKATKEDAKQKATLPPSGFKVVMHVLEFNREERKNG